MRSKVEKTLIFGTCGARAKDTEGVQCMGPGLDRR